MRKLNISLLLAILLTPAISLAADFSGTWKVNATGYVLTIKINQASNGSITGTVNNSFDDTISGSAVGRMIRFTRTNDYLTSNSGAHPQVYTGFLYTNGPAVMAGSFTHRGSPRYGWYGHKQ